MNVLIGLVAAFAVLITALALGGAPAAYFNLVGLLIVVAGSLAVTVISFSPEELVAAPATVWRLMTEPREDAAETAVQLLELSESARKDGILALQRALPGIEDDVFLTRAVQLVVDGANPDEIEHLLRREAAANATRETHAIDVLRRLGEVAPAMGLIGTVIGLVRMLGSLTDPNSIGPAMAVALLTTFYGLVLSQMVFIPLATKAERMAVEETLKNELCTLGAASIGRNENPRRLEMLMNTILPPTRRVRYFE
ncbi:MAG: motility protein A [Rhodothalassiaceae bacterium]